MCWPTWPSTETTPTADSPPIDDREPEHVEQDLLSTTTRSVPDRLPRSIGTTTTETVRPSIGFEIRRKVLCTAVRGPRRTACEAVARGFVPTTIRRILAAGTLKPRQHQS